MVGLILACGLVLPARRGLPVEFDVVYNATVGRHTADPNGARLEQIVGAAADRWSDVIEDAYTIDVEIGYGDLDNVCPNPTQGAVACFLIDQIDDARVASGSIFFSNSANWFYDSTPDRDEEFDLETTLFQDLVPPAFPVGTQFTHYHGFGFEPVLEVGVVGPTSIGSLADTDDLLTAAMREMGRLLGITRQIPATLDEYQSDHDFDFPQPMLGGVGMAAATVDGSTDIGLLNPLPLLSYHAPERGTRRLPSATDILSLASLGWHEIDLDRKHLLSRGDGDFQNATNWTGGTAPDRDDAAIIASGRTTWMSGPAEVRELVVTDTDLILNGWTLSVLDDVQINRHRQAAANRVTVGEQAALEVAGLVQLSAAVLMLDGGTVLANRVSIASGSTLSGAGTLRVADGLTVDGSSRVEVELRTHGLDGPTTLTIEGGVNLEPQSTLRTTIDPFPNAPRGQTRRFDVLLTDRPITGQFRDWEVEQGDNEWLLSGDERNHIGQGRFLEVDYHDAGATLVDYFAVAGDSDGDGRFDSTDLLTVLQLGEYEDAIPGNSNWVDGDWNLDGDFTSSDFITALQAGFYQASTVSGSRDDAGVPAAPTASVPEPESRCALAWIAGLLMLTRRTISRALHPTGCRGN